MSEPFEPPAGGLTKLVVRAGASLALMSAIENLLGLARALVLSRLLAPGEFGLMGMAFIAIAAADVFSQTGFGRALVQRQDDADPFLHTVWTISVVRGILLTGIVTLAAPLLGAFFRSHEVVPVLRVVSLGMFLRGFHNPRMVLLEREMKLMRLAMPRTIGAAIDLAVTTGFAFPLRSVWAMVIGYLAGIVGEVVVSYAAFPFAPRVRVDVVRARQLYSFGKHVFRYDLIHYLINQGDRVAVGRLRDVTSLGYYSFASRLATLPALTLFGVVLRTVFPAFARIQGEPDRLRGAFARLMGLLAATSFPLAAGLFVTAPEMVPVMFGEQWIPMTFTFQILCLLGVTTALEQTCIAVAGSIGRPDLVVRASIVRLVLMAPMIIPATIVFGIEGAAATMTTAATAATFYLLQRLTHTLDAPFRIHARSFAIPALSCVVLVAAVATLRAIGPPLPTPALLALMVLVGASVYIAAVAAMDRVTGSGLTASVRALIRFG